MHSNCIYRIIYLDLDHGGRGDQIESAGNDSEKSSRQWVKHIASTADTDHA